MNKEELKIHLLEEKLRYYTAKADYWILINNDIQSNLASTSLNVNNQQLSIKDITCDNGVGGFK